MPNAQRSPDGRYLSLINVLQFRPMFIMGSHRSGTTLLHRLLAETGCFNVVRAYHVINYDRIVTNHMEGGVERSKQELAGAFARAGMKSRIIDEVPATPDAPAEYGFVMGRENRRPRLTPETLPKFVELCRKVQFIEDPERPIILKNPWDAIRFAYIKQALPQAKFVFIHRHPLPVMNSFLQALRSVLSARNEYLRMLAPWYQDLFDRPAKLFLSRLAVSPRLGIGESLMARYILRVTNYFVENIGAIPAADCLIVRYEDLCAQPQAQMENILKFLEVSPRQQRDWSEQVRPRRLNVLPAIRRKYVSIQPQLQPYLTFHHYEAEPAGIA